MGPLDALGLVASVGDFGALKFITEFQAGFFFIKAIGFGGEGFYIFCPAGKRNREE